MMINGGWLNHAFERANEDENLMTFDAQSAELLLERCQTAFEANMEPAETEEDKNQALANTMIEVFMAGYAYRQGAETPEEMDQTITIPLKLPLAMVQKLVQDALYVDEIRETE